MHRDKMLPHISKGHIDAHLQSVAWPKQTFPIWFKGSRLFCQDGHKALYLCHLHTVLIDFLLNISVDAHGSTVLSKMRGNAMMQLFTSICIDTDPNLLY